MPEYKSGPQLIKSIDGREVTGLFSTFGVIDSYNDRVMPGAFIKTFQERMKKTLFLWQHDFNAPPVAVIKSMREVGLEELPTEIRADFPEATGGAEVVREYLPTPRGDEALAAITAGAPLQMSFGYDAVRYDFEELPDAKYEWEKLRNLREIRLWEVSDVLWGANEATLASKGAFTVPLEILLKQLQTYMDELKAGARNAASDLERIRTIAKLAVELGADNVKLLDAEEGDDKSRAAKGTQSPVEVSGIWLRNNPNAIEVLAEVGSKWKLVISEPAMVEAGISHIVEPIGIASSPEDKSGIAPSRKGDSANDEPQRRAGALTVPPLTLLGESLKLLELDLISGELR